jgi:hemerythrin-like metal-binding protein
MVPLRWSELLSHDLPFFDRAHQEFVRLLARVQLADDAEVEPAWRHLVDYAAVLFGREDRYMQQTRFASREAHGIQHRVVLVVMREGLAQAEEGKLLQVREMANQLAGWYVHHVRTMDAAFALHLRGAGVDGETGAIAAQSRVPAARPVLGAFI